MKKIFALVVILLSCTCFNALGKDFGNDDGVRITLPKFVNYKNVILDEKIKQAEIIDKSEDYSNDYATVNIYKPEIHLSSNPDSERLINMKIDNIVNSFKNRVVEDSLKDNEFNKTNGLPIRQYVVNVNNTIHYNKGNILSLTLHLYSFTGGAHGSTTDVSLNFDTDTGKNGVIKDFLGNNVGYDEIILNEIKSQVSKNPEMYFKEEVDKITKLPYNQKFFLTEDSIVVYFDEYVIAPYVGGRPQFAIPYTRFPKGLTKIHIATESPSVISLMLELLSEDHRYNQYICVPQLEGYTIENNYEGINKEIIANISDYIKVLERAENIEHIQGITTYYTYIYIDKDIILLDLNYIINMDENINKEVTMRYTVDIGKNKVYKQ